MTTRSLPRLGLLVTVAVVSLSVHASCARSVSSELQEDAPLLAPDAGKVATQNLCVSRECPAPFATCPGTAGLCTTNLKSDVGHCGSCDTPCPRSRPHARSLCSGGQCRIACAALYADCNGLAEDGCEVDVESDPANCGACNKACAEGVLCWLGACGCPSGLTQCGLDCKALDSDAQNCGACGKVCGPPSDDADPAWICGPRVKPPHTQWACLSSACALSCKPGFGDCNNQFCADGCEQDLLGDPKNCGTCGHACDPGQTCESGTCLCPPGTTRCGDECVELQSDVLNCGACNERCPGPSGRNPLRPSGGGPECKDGKCSYVCFPGFADCDGLSSNGCEVNVLTDPAHCGGCETSCNVPAGQPCVGGKCLTKECDAGVLN